jgi:Domain of unknown function (DUF4145)
MAFSWICGYCGQGVSVVGPTWGGFDVRALYLCPMCEEPSVVAADGHLSPPTKAFPPVKHLQTDVEAAWDESVAAFGNGAYTAAEMMCRKILMHIAVDVAGSAPGKKFAEYISDLEGSGYIITGLTPRIDDIRTRGNAANHELPSSTEEEARRTLAVTRYLLVSVYELPNS